MLQAILKINLKSYNDFIKKTWESDETPENCNVKL